MKKGGSVPTKVLLSTFKGLIVLYGGYLFTPDQFEDLSGLVFGVCPSLVGVKLPRLLPNRPDKVENWIWTLTGLWTLTLTFGTTET